MGLSTVEEEVLQAILEHYVDNEKKSIIVTNNIFPQYAFSNLNQYFNSLKSKSLIADYNRTMEDTEIYLTPDGIDYFKNKKIEMFPKNSMDLLHKLLDQDNPVIYMQYLFEGLDNKADNRLRAMMRDLREKGYIKTLWSDNVPDYIEFNEKAYSMKDEEEMRDNINISDVAKEAPEYDVFISHANRDKEDFVEELYQSINKLGINIFYDKESLEWGDNWKATILNGTEKAKFAMIVISENFFDREWTEKELTELLNRQNRNGQKLILPILHNITMTQLQEKYPSVANIQAIDSKKFTCDQIAILFARQLIKRLKNV